MLECVLKCANNFIQDEDMSQNQKTFHFFLSFLYSPEFILGTFSQNCFVLILFIYLFIYLVSYVL